MIGIDDSFVMLAGLPLIAAALLLVAAVAFFGLRSDRDRKEEIDEAFKEFHKRKDDGQVQDVFEPERAV